MEMYEIFLDLAIIITFAKGFGIVARKLHAPQVVGEIIAGLLIGPSVLGIIPADVLSGFDLISEIALGFIAFSIGGEFKISYFKRVGMTPIVIMTAATIFLLVWMAGGTALLA